MTNYLSFISANTHYIRKIIATVDSRRKCAVIESIEEELCVSSTIALFSNSNPPRSFAPTTLLRGFSGINVAFIVMLYSVGNVVVVAPLKDGVERDVEVVDTNASGVFVLVISEDAVVGKFEVVLVVNLVVAAVVDDDLSVVVANAVVCEVGVETLVDDVVKSVLAAVVEEVTISSSPFTSVALAVAD
mmetsp:Transcript_26203/g.52439  ORF Transcript_26203/g.52439 Transcript_26203/m.52439 type:complete len:188 (-) Transcript_26203:752-1315(-)